MLVERLLFLLKDSQIVKEMIDVISKDGDIVEKYKNVICD